MLRPKKKVGQKVQTFNGGVGYIVETQASSTKTFLGHQSADEYFGRFDCFYHTVAFEDDRGQIRTETHKE